jgi:hypothetical protein
MDEIKRNISLSKPLSLLRDEILVVRNILLSGTPSAGSAAQIHAERCRRIA